MSSVCTSSLLHMGPVHCLRNPQPSFFNKTFIKNRFNGTIHTFKNYFAAVFLVFNNKRYPNIPLMFFFGGGGGIDKDIQEVGSPCVLTRWNLTKLILSKLVENQLILGPMITIYGQESPTS